jgi:hypothetical protein
LQRLRFSKRAHKQDRVYQLWPGRFARRDGVQRNGDASEAGLHSFQPG